MEPLNNLHEATLALTTENARRLITRRGMEDPGRRVQVQQLLDTAPPDAINHPQLRIIERHGLTIRRGLSFHAIMIQRSEAACHADVQDRSWLLDEKAAGYRFADGIGVRRPTGDLTPRSLAEITPEPPAVVKPLRATGARGVFLVHSDDHIVEVRTGEVLTSWAEVVARGNALISDTRRPVRDRWITEELILDKGRPARDLKFFAFYGEVLFVQEIDRLPTFKACYWSPEGQPIETGKPAALTDGYGVTQEQVAIAQDISSQIPSPFTRIDTLRSGPQDLVVGEFTPRPGQFEEFDATTDRKLAEAWVRAERRLLDDALNGVKFHAFDAATA